MQNNNKSLTRSPALVFKLPGITLVGRSAVVALFVFLALIVALILYFKPTFSPSPLWVSLALWVGSGAIACC
jgi:hypothetical protein